ncbi:winged helix-turn-helix domain-containing protein [Candidatus Nanohalococcus occultus]|uniref:Transcriptional regulator containing HTH domain,ArsR family n=1 Tax=Candidatus Nanohalococcus occultus TaxID=2978047 RepID=A0ABY8CJQ6_9ARCH|nr:Transcriptional regulator containing HTH domain,ArsR family [Candidatus Nanohaloarchaeota archaeon SVXNc]
MEIDRKTVEALASPTRIEILKAALEGESTTTDISEEIQKTKSTVSSHIEKLTEAQLLEKDAEEGRRRVNYTPTRKARSIIKGRRKKMQFSLLTGFAAIIAGGAAFWNYFEPMSTNSAEATVQSREMTAMAMDTAARGTAETSNTGGVPELELVFLAAGAVFFSVSIISFLYGYVMMRLKAE